MKRIIVPILLLMILKCDCSKTTIEENKNSKDSSLYIFNSGNTEIEKNEWESMNFIHPDSSSWVLRITLKEKYDRYYEVYCKALFSNKKTRQYKLIAPWLEDFIIDWSLTTSKMAEKIPLDSVPEERKEIRKFLERK